MAEIRELDAILPNDIEYHYRGQKLVLPGDIDVEHTYKLLGLLQRADEVESAALRGQKVIGGEQVLVAKKENDEQIAAALLELFRQRDSELATLPFGVTGLRLVLVDALIAMGFQFVQAGDASPPAKARTRSGRSSSSQRSSKSSASRTRTS